MSAVKKVIIPVAGFGTRFLPATKAQPKEMLPVVDKPIIQYVVESAVAAGITDIILVTGPSKRAVEDHFSPSPELARWLTDQGKGQLATMVNQISDLANFVFIRQKGPYGNGTPVLSAKSVIGNEPFAVLWGDEFFHAPERPHLAQLIDTFERYGHPVLTTMQVDDEGTNRYGILEAKQVDPTTYQVQSIVEKPGPQATLSRLASLGGFIFTPDIFTALEHTPVGKGGELWLADAIAKLLETQSVYAKLVQGTYFDTGSKLGWLKANVTLSLAHPELGADFKTFLHSL